jgi:putative N6-adenine-specific DNA methylase/tRNA (guanine6-N2)-methyltransferase
MTHLMLTTTPGLEDVAAAELRERVEDSAGAAVHIEWPEAGVAGRVEAKLGLQEEQVRAITLSMRSIHHALRHVATVPIGAEGGLARIERCIMEREWPELDRHTPFRVTGSRAGDHDFSSYMLQCAAGAALQSRTGAPVDLEGYRVNVQVDVVRDRCLIGVRWSSQPLGLRHARPFNRRVALKPPVAYALLRLGADTAGATRILDPFCGTGTILLEAGACFPEAILHGSDISPACVDGARENLAAAGLTERVVLRQGDGRRLRGHWPGEPHDLLVTNPPYGRRMGRGMNFTRFYTDLLEGAAQVVRPGGRLALLVGKRGAFNKAVARVGRWQVRHARLVDMNQVHAGLLVLALEGT